jgi:methyltransferase (TIGR00027 family)
MKALDAGCQQFVILAAGLDARAWRLPRLDKSITVFEVDCAKAHAYKAETLASLTPPPLACTRFEVEADLSQPSWSAKLTEAGFDPSKPSFFLIEGLLMYLPPEAPHRLLATVSSLMCAGSTVAGDTFVGGVLAFHRDNSLLRQIGTLAPRPIQHDAMDGCLSSAPPLTMDPPPGC